MIDWIQLRIEFSIDFMNLTLFIEIFIIICSRQICYVCLFTLTQLAHRNDTDPVWCMLDCVIKSYASIVSSFKFCWKDWDTLIEQSVILMSISQYYSNIAVTKRKSILIQLTIKWRQKFWGWKISLMVYYSYKLTLLAKISGIILGIISIFMWF